MNPEELQKHLAEESGLKYEGGHSSTKFVCGNGSFGSVALAASESAVEDGEEYLSKKFRILSKIMIPDRFLDFSMKDVLQESFALLKDGTLTLYADHYKAVEEFKGKVVDFVWDAENKVPGINGLVMIDKAIAPKLARGVQSGALNAGSVTVFFNYERSHAQLSERQFYSSLGDEIDGEIVRFIVTKISGFGEYSIVWEGADPHAKGFCKGENKFLKGGEENVNELEKLLTSLNLKDVGELKTALQSVDALKVEMEALKASAAIGDAHLTTVREKAVKFYKLAKGEDFKESFATVINGSDLETATAFKQEYESAAEALAPLVCEDCGGAVSRRSSLAEETDKTKKQAVLSVPEWSKSL